MATMFKAFFEQAGHPVIVRIFRNKGNAVQFLRDQMSKNG
jgi:hypothetical protein